jgi:hypothetical protein
MVPMSRAIVKIPEAEIAEHMKRDLLLGKA